MSLDKMLEGWRDLARTRTAYLNGGDRSPLSEQDLESFERAAETRPPKDLKPADLKAYLNRENLSDGGDSRRITDGQVNDSKSWGTTLTMFGGCCEYLWEDKYIVCDNCADANDPGSDARWCEHIQDTMMTDEAFEHTLISNTKGGFLDIPMIPTLNMYETVYISDQTYGDDDIRKVTWSHPAPHNDYDESLDFVCFLSPGEGRLTIRSVMFDMCTAAEPLWNKGHGPNDYTCALSSHGFAQESEFVKMIARTNYKLQPSLKWSLFSMGSCLECRKWLDYSKDIPDTDDKKFPVIKNPRRLITPTFS